MKLKSMISYLFIPILLASLALACTDTNDLGLPCELIRGNSQKITEKDAREELARPATGSKPGAVVFQDIISFGVPECEDLACVRSPAFNPGPVVDDNSPAKGYCSLRCSSEGSTCTASSSKEKFVCRPLMLDKTTLEQACQGNPEFCEDFGSVSSTLFCAMP